MKKKQYQPKGRMVILAAAIRAEPTRIWTSRELADVMGISVRKVGGYVTYALGNAVLFRKKEGRFITYSGTPFPGQEPAPALKKRSYAKYKPASQWTPEGDIRIPRVVPGWRPPQMVCVRLAA